MKKYKILIDKEMNFILTVFRKKFLFDRLLITLFTVMYAHSIL